LFQDGAKMYNEHDIGLFDDLDCVCSHKLSWAEKRQMFIASITDKTEHETIAAAQR
jgi:hypothetical protein